MKRKDEKKFEVRRIQGAKLLRKGYSYAEVAKALKVSRQSVRVWALKMTVSRQSIDDLGTISSSFSKTRNEFFENKRSFKLSYENLRPSRLGRPELLSSSNLTKLKVKLKIGALKYGFESSQWTLKRIALMIDQEFRFNRGALSTSQVLRVLKKIGFTCKKPPINDVYNYSRWEKYRWYEFK